MAKKVKWYLTEVRHQAIRSKKVYTCTKKFRSDFFFFLIKRYENKSKL